MRIAWVIALFVAIIPTWAQGQESLGDAARRMRENKPDHPAAPVWSGEGNPVQAALAGKSWAVAVEAPGFVVKQSFTKPDGRQYLLADNPATGMVISITLEKSAKGANVNTCPEYLGGRIQALQREFRITSVRYMTVSKMTAVEYFLPEAQGRPVRQNNLVACTAKEDVFIDIHLSKALFKPQEEPLFRSALDGVHIVDNTLASASPVVSEADARQNFAAGSRFWLQHKYQEAIEPYSMALEQEKKKPTLEKHLWRVLVDNLGMAYGITGDLRNAEATFRYGLSQDPTYPMFFYNMACVYGEKNDLDNALLNLRQAYQYRANSIPGEGLPDPRTDDSFKRFTGNPKFQAVAESFAKAK